MSLLRKITSIIRRAVVSLSLPDEDTYPTTQVSYLGKTSDIEVIWPYGTGGRLPVDAQVLCFNVEAMEENKAGIGSTPTIRFKVDKEGEVWFGNPLSGSVLHFIENGDANLESPVINLGPNGSTFRKLIDERFEALFNAHTHPDPVSGNSGIPSQQLVPGAQTTANTKAA